MYFEKTITIMIPHLPKHFRQLCYKKTGALCASKLCVLNFKTIAVPNQLYGVCMRENELFVTPIFMEVAVIVCFNIIGYLSDSVQ